MKRIQFNHRPVRSLTLMVMAVVLAIACGGGGGTSSTPGKPSFAPIRVVTVPCFCTEYIAQSLGLYKKAGLDVTDIPATQFGVAAIQVVAAGQAESGPPITFAGLLLARAGNADVVAVVNNYVSAPGPSQAARFYVTAGSSIHTASDLKGKKVGIWGRGTLGDYVLDAYLRDHGMTESDVQIIVVQPTQLEAALKSGQIDVAGTYDIVYARMERDGGFRQLFSDLDIKSLPATDLSNAYFFSKAFIDQHKETVRAFVDITVQAQRWVLDHPKDAKAIIAKATGFAAEDLIIPVWKPPSCLTASAASKWAEFLSVSNKAIKPTDGPTAIRNDLNSGCKSA